VSEQVTFASAGATLYGQPEKAAIFAYEKGATMNYESLAPAPQMMFFLNNDTFGNPSPAGVSLFDAAVDWAAAGGAGDPARTQLVAGSACTAAPAAVAI
jgi:hypothetical protein